MAALVIEQLKAVRFPVPDDDELYSTKVALFSCFFGYSVGLGACAAENLCEKIPHWSL